MQQIQSIILRNNHDLLWDSSDRTVTVNCIVSLLFSDNPRSGIRAIELVDRNAFHVLNEDYIMEALGFCDDPSVAEYLAGLPESNIFNAWLAGKWIRALGQNPQAVCKEKLLNLFDEIKDADQSQRTWDNGAVEALVETLANVALSDSSIWEQIKNRCARATTDPERIVLARILQKVNNDEAALSACALINEKGQCPQSVRRLFEEVLTRKVPAGSEGSFYSFPRPFNRLRQTLADMVLRDPIKRRGAYALLAFIENFRVEHGRPVDEPRHPSTELRNLTDSFWMLSAA